MPKQSTDKKPRRLHAPETMRERATKHSQVKPSRPSRFAAATMPFRRLGRVRELKIMRPVVSVGNFLGRFFVPPYIRSSFHELRNVSWPNRKQTFRLTSAVLIFALVFGTIVAIVDFGLDKLFKQVILR